MSKVWLGVDTSNYTTSVSAVLEDETVYNVKIPLCVKPGEKGVRQSDALFMHVKNLPVAFNKLASEMGEKLKVGEISAIGVSTRPRNVEGSYMPCFLSGISVATSISELLKVDLFEFSHQEGHIRSASFGANMNLPETFYSFHLSGGTCELLECKKNDFGFTCEILSSSSDITLGQLVDRTGVMLGLNFPCGTELEKLAQRSTKTFKVKVTEGNGNVNLSGFENKVEKMIKENTPSEHVARYVYDVILNTINKMLERRKDITLPVIFAGGVSGSKILQNYVSTVCDAYFAPPPLSCDNAVGVALLTRDKFLKVNSNE
ncbi:MAG: hypothetical protein E7582_03675 [Ruminococcaceae bacterium]|nr:hypothetical protein [Oscillospiraceae bacterium]